jgi:hemerythrin-like domain-containing protein
MFGSIDFEDCWITNRNKDIFSLARIFTNLRKSHLQIENLEKFIFVNKNWPNDPKIGCKSSSNL